MATSDHPVGLNVWAKIVQSRPWPAYVIEKRRPSAKHKDLCPVHFYGPVEEFSWVEPDCIIPLTADNLVEFARDGCSDPDFFAAVYQAYKGQAWPNPETGAIFKTAERLLQHAGNGPSLLDRMDETKTQLANTCIKYIAAATPTRTKRSTLLSESEASMLSGIFDDTIPPPKCLLDVKSDESPSDTDGDSDADDGDADVFAEPAHNDTPAPEAGLTTPAAAAVTESDHGGAATSTTATDQHRADAGTTDHPMPPSSPPAPTVSTAPPASTTGHPTRGGTGTRGAPVATSAAPASATPVPTAPATPRPVRNRPTTSSFSSSAAAAPAAAATTTAHGSPSTPVREAGRLACHVAGCGKTFANNQALYGHLRVHGGAVSKVARRSRGSSATGTSESKRRALALPVDPASAHVDARGSHDNTGGAGVTAATTATLTPTNPTGGGTASTGTAPSTAPATDGVVSSVEHGARAAAATVDSTVPPDLCSDPTPMDVEDASNTATETDTDAAPTSEADGHAASPTAQHRSTTSTHTAALASLSISTSTSSLSSPPSRALSGSHAPMVSSLSHHLDSKGNTEHHESRVGPQYQATIPPCPETNDVDRTAATDKENTSASTSKNSADGPSPEAECVWTPVDELSDTDVDAYLKFACTKGILGPGMERWTSRGHEYALHVLHRAMAEAETETPTKPLMIRALLSLTERKRLTGGAPIAGYHYEGDSVWSVNEIEKFKKGLRTHGKNFPYIQSSSLKTKSLADLIEFYYYFKSTEAYKPIRAAQKFKEQQELQKTLKEGLLTCDHCHKTSTVEWHVGDNGQDWCDSCHAHFTKRTVVQVRSTLSKPQKPDARRKEGVYKCDQCDKIFHMPNSLYGHMRVHADPKPSKQSAQDKKSKAKKSSKK
eukprot:m.10162 g.10162  ORF g.10162 m.10162 type:complete len:891 (-) comp2719_c0_seq1:192-2864(-)